MQTSDKPIDAHINALRSFNRFYSRRFELLGERLLDSEFSLSEARVMYELAHSPDVTATDLSRRLQLDPGYLSRMLRKFSDAGLIEKHRSRDDARQHSIVLTKKGRSSFSKLNQASANQLRELLSELTDDQQDELVRSVARVQELLEGNERSMAYLLRPPASGDFGWIIARHGYLYAKEYGWSESFEALVAEIVAQYIVNRDRQKDACWIAEVAGQRAGCAFVVHETNQVAKFRLLLVEPQFRRMGIGRRLIEECIRFAKQAGYSRATFWTNSPLKDARRLYDRLGFKLVKEERHSRFGPEMIGQTFEMKLR